MSIETSSQRRSAIGAKQASNRISLPSLRLRTSERKLLLLLVDLLIVNLALIASIHLGWHEPVPASLLLASTKWYITLAAAWVVGALFLTSMTWRAPPAPPPSCAAPRRPPCSRRWSIPSSPT